MFDNHTCNAYCRDGAHTRVVYSTLTDVTEAERELCAYVAPAYGVTILAVREATEALPPNPQRAYDAWIGGVRRRYLPAGGEFPLALLVTYRLRGQDG